MDQILKILTENGQKMDIIIQNQTKMMADQETLSQNQDVLSQNQIQATISNVESLENIKSICQGISVITADTQENASLTGMLCLVSFSFQFCLKTIMPHLVVNNNFIGVSDISKL